jgi:hypothetical protein
MRCEVRNMLTREPILHIAKLVFVNLDESGQPAPHGKTAISYIKDRLQVKEMPLSAASNLPEEETEKKSNR